NSWNDVPLVSDIGFLASKDPVALDQASVDLVNKAAGKDLFCSHHRGTNWRAQLDHAEAMGLGSRAYRLVRVG
ncbi:MAG: 4Fe-4S ferredoxin, partial [Firmicutes bacterium]|nr:4Fe-4S ferredoxin [Bacillota bacterium]